MISDTRFGLLCKASLLLFTLGSAVGCSSDSADDEQNNNNDGGGTATGSMQVKLSGSVALLAQDQTVTETAKANQKISSKSGRPLFTYEVVNQGLTEQAAASLRKAGAAGMVTGVDSTTTGGTNLLAVDADGNAHLALESDLPIKVMYSVADPAGEYVYLALDTGWWSWDGNDYSQFIAKNNCAFYRVKIADDTFSCVKEGIFVQNMDDNYMKSISGNQKPVQFDADSNVYFTGTTFTRECDQGWDQNNDGTVSDDEKWCWVNNTSWNPRIYKMAAADGTVTALTQDNTSVQFFLALSTGEIAYQSTNTQTWESSLYIWQNSQTINLTDNGWGVNFFTTDTSNTVMWGDWETAGIRFGRPSSGGGVYRATLDTTLFGDTRGGNTTPYRIITGDDGRLYGVFESWRSECVDDEDPPNGCDTDGSEWEYSSVLSVYQILPYDPVPKVELTLDQSDSWAWWNWMSETPFQISKGFLYYTETKNVEIDGASYGTADVIHMVRLADRTKQTILADGLTSSTGARYEIYSWRLSGDELHFSALDQSRTVVVTGKIDTALVKQGVEQAQYLSLDDSASAVGSTAKIQDIEIITPKQPATDTGLDPVVQQFHVSEDNRYSVSVDFSKYMDKASVEENLSFVKDPDGTPSDVTTMKLWLYQTLHLIPDTDGLGNTTTTPLANGAQYKLTVGAATRDAWNWLIAEGTQGTWDPVEGISNSWSTLPTFGWWAATSDDASEVFSSGKMAKFLGRANTSDWMPETYDLNVDASGHVRVEFSARNVGWDGLQVALWNKTKAASNPNDPYNNSDVRISFGAGWAEMRYKYTYTDSWGTYTWDEYKSDWNVPSVFNGNWGRYRIDAYGANIRVYYSTTGTADGDFVELANLAASNFAGTNADEYTLMLRVTNPVVNVDNITLTNLDVYGATTGTVRAGPLTFDTGLEAGFDTNVEGVINPNNWWW